MPKNRYRKSEPIPLRVRIPPPDSTLVQDKGLHLRSVSAELVRTITSASNTSTAVLCRTGKSCRFSADRQLSLRLTLPPRLHEDVGCESITQETIFHNIAFFVRLTVALTGRDPSDRQDLTFDTSVGIMPDLYSTRASEKQKEALDEALDSQHHFDLVPSYVEIEGPSTSRRRPEYVRMAAAEAGWSYDSDEEPEHDGYEESAALEADAMAHPPPAISDDVSPPVLSPSASLMDSVARSFIESNPANSTEQLAGNSNYPELPPQQRPLPPSPPRPPLVLPAINGIEIIDSATLSAEESSSNGDSVESVEGGVDEHGAPPPSYRDDGNQSNSLMIPMMLHMSSSPAAGPPPYSL